MDNFLGTLIFILPGFLMYFWLQAFGMNPVVKHSPAELTAISALLWLPVSFITLMTYNTFAFYTGFSNQIWTIDELKSVYGNLGFLFLFLLLSTFVSFFLSVMWAHVLHKIPSYLINSVRKARGMAPLSSTASVWEEVFIKVDESQKEKEIDHKDKVMVLQIYKIDKPEEFIIGSMTKASRPFEPDKAIVLEDTKEWQEALDDYEIPVKRIYFDTKSGLVIKELEKDHSKYTVKEQKESSAYIT